MSYQAVVTKITGLQKHPNADRLQMCLVLGNTVIVGMDAKEGDVGVFFNVDGQLSEAFATANDLIRRKDKDGKPAGGLFDQNRKVRAQKLRGVKSEGFFTPLSYLEFTGYNTSKLKEGDSFDELNGHKICNKYFTPATLKAMANRGKKLHQPKSVMFYKHFDTPQLRQLVGMINPGALITITEKMHGTSFRLGHVLEEREPGWVSRFLNFLRNREATGKKQWTLLNGTRNTILWPRDRQKQGFHGGEEFRYTLGDRVGMLLKKGETLYGEIVGWANGATIMPTVETKTLKDPEFTAKYGERMAYSYGCLDGEREFYVYRITQTNEDGYVVELPFAAVKERCKILGVKHVVELTAPFIYDGDKEKLLALCESLTEGPSVHDQKHIREGIGVRAEQGLNPVVLKNKSFAFKVLEGIIKDKDDYVDAEEAA